MHTTTRLPTRRLMPSLVALACLHCLAARAQTAETALPAVVVTASPFGNDETSQILAPAKVLSGNELRDKLGVNLGDTLSREAGISASSFGAGASRPVIRGLEGPRVKILQNGMSVLDVSTLSNDHAVAAESSTARQIEILRGPAALLYGSGAIGGLVNVVNERIPTARISRAFGETELRFGSADHERSLSFSADAGSGPYALHVDGSARNTHDYGIPGNAVLGDYSSSSGRLPSSFTRTRDLGFGASHVDSWGHIGASVSARDDRYGIPGEEQAYIDLSQTRWDLDGMVKLRFAGFDALRMRAGHTDYAHTEHESGGEAAVRFANRATETRWELTRSQENGTARVLGIQTERSRFSALPFEDGAVATVPVTRSSSAALFLVEERHFGPLTLNAGTRFESVQRKPDGASGLSKRGFDLLSWSFGGLWNFTSGYSAGSTFSVARRAPSIEELYSSGPHESTRSFDIGDAALRRELSRNLELTLQKSQGLFRWKANLFENRVDDFIFGVFDGVLVDESGTPDPAGEFGRRFFMQRDARIRGGEAELSYNWKGEGWSARAFLDRSRGSLREGGSLPLQPADRLGVEFGYRQAGWRTGISILHSRRQDRLAASESFETPSATRIDLSISQEIPVGSRRWTWFARINNVLDEDIRLSTSVLREQAPQPGRSAIGGIRMRF